MENRPKSEPAGPSQKNNKKIKLVSLVKKKQNKQGSRKRRQKACEDCGVTCQDRTNGKKLVVLQIKQCGHYVCNDCILSSVKSTDYFNTNCPVKLMSGIPGTRDCDTAFCSGTLSVDELHEVLDEDDFSIFMALTESNNQPSIIPDKLDPFRFKIVSFYDSMIKSCVVRFKRRTSLPPKPIREIHCQKPKCEGFCMVEEGRDPGSIFVCPLCKSRNCLKCNSIHLGSCFQKMKDESFEESDIDDLLDYDMFSDEGSMDSPELDFMEEEDEEEEEYLNNDDEEYPIIMFERERECYICFCVMHSTKDGRILARCGHSVCCQCLQGLVNSSKGYPLHCPDAFCTGYLTKDEFRKFSNKKTFEKNKIDLDDPMIWREFHCLKKGCKGRSADIMEEVFYCRHCMTINCVKCNAIHNGISCEEYKTSMKDRSDSFNASNSPPSSQNPSFASNNSNNTNSSSSNNNNNSKKRVQGSNTTNNSKAISSL